MLACAFQRCIEEFTTDLVHLMIPREKRVVCQQQLEDIHYIKEDVVVL